LHEDLGWGLMIVKLHKGKIQNMEKEKLKSNQKMIYVNILLAKALYSQKQAFFFVLS